MPVDFQYPHIPLLRINIEWNALIFQHKSAHLSKQTHHVLMRPVPELILWPLHKYRYDVAPMLFLKGISAFPYLKFNRDAFNAVLY